MFRGDKNVLSDRINSCLTNKRNRKTILSIAISAILISAVFSLLFHFGFQKSNSPKQVTAKNGVIDLSKWSYKRDGAVKLIGNWEFYWNELLTSKQVDSQAFKEKEPTTKVPGLWKNTFVNGKKLPNEGFATYKLLIKMDSLRNSVNH
jgi:two-component system sensor histidine kinase ChiS